MNVLIVFLGSGIGGALRYGVHVATVGLGWADLPAGTFTVNLAGSFLMGALIGHAMQRGGFPEPWHLLLATGFLGGFTTFSAFSLDAVLLHERGRLGLSILYAVGSVVLSIGALVAAMALVRLLPRG